MFDPVLTDTARYADVVLPAATFLERREISRGYGALVLQDARAVVAPAGRGAVEPGCLRRAVPPHRRGADRRSRVRRRARVGAAGLFAPRCGPAASRSIAESSRSGGGRAAGPVRRRLSARRPTAKSISCRRSSIARPRAGSTPIGRTRRRRGSRWRSFRPATDRTISSTLGELHRSASPARAPPGRRGRARDRRRSSDPRLQRPRRGPLPRPTEPGPQGRRRPPAQGHLVAQHRQRLDRDGPRRRTR